MNIHKEISPCKFLALPLWLALAFLAISCGAVNTLTGGDNFKAVGALWSDVPAMDGLGKPIEAELPSSIKLFMRTGVNLMMKGLGEDAPEWDWLMFNTTKTPDDIKNFYTTSRMAAAPYNWASDASGCVSGQQAIAQGGVFCVFNKEQGDKQIGLLIITVQDEKSKETSVFFLRGESAATPAAQSASTASEKPTRGAITMLNGTAPYGIEKRPMPDGLDLEQLLPKQVGSYSRVLLEKSEQRGVQPTSIEVDGNGVYATYRSGGAEIFVEFDVTSSAANAQLGLETAASETTPEFPTDPRFGSIGTEPSYLLVNNEYGAFFAWTRGGYYFSASAKSGQAALDAFMQAFPY
ncbi:MAG: hypothetical protein HY741_06805 [Chloroflexi bacterium]|nr:hypothetical protein [Chloroflexota bacterium]